MTNPAVLPASAMTVTNVSFRHAVFPHLGLEAISLSDMTGRISAAHFARPSRPDFNVRVLYTAGRSEHMVDFERYTVVPGTLLTVKPGQVHQFQLRPGLEAQLILVDRSFILPKHLAYVEALASPIRSPACRMLSEELVDEFLWAASRIAADTARHANHPLVSTLLRQRLYALLVLLQISADDGAPRLVGNSTGQELMKEFMALLEVNYMRRWSVKRYAARLGYAEKTLSRACQQWTGQTAKSLVDDRVVLEAKRSLAHGSDSIASVSHMLGFSEPANFIHFFERHAGLSPSAFRRLQQFGSRE